MSPLPTATEKITLHDAWVSLRHGGNLLTPVALDGLPNVAEPSWGLADRLRSALVALEPDSSGSSSALGTLFDVVFDDACGLEKGWEKGSTLGAADAEKLLDGTILKPRRRWTGPANETLLIFTSAETRLGVGRGRRPAAQVIEYLRRRSDPLGLLTNGTQWRLIWADADSLAWVEWEAERWLDADQISGELDVLRRVLSSATLTRGTNEVAPLLAAIRDSRRGEASLSKVLGERVRQAVETLLRSREALIGPAWEDHQSTDLYVAACHFMMRLVVTLFAEARDLLPTNNPVYHRTYGLRSLLDQLDRLTRERRQTRHMAWPRLLALFRLLHQGSPHPAMTLPAYGGDLFAPGETCGDGVQRALALLETFPKREPPDDDVIHEILVLLTRTSRKVREGAHWRTVAAPIDFTELTSEYIGILYEGLLDYELRRAHAQPIVFLNLGNQPALPLDRLEDMDDKGLKELVEKAKVKKQTATEESDDETSAENESDDEAERENEPDAERVVAVDAADDARAEARRRALVWAKRAANVTKLAGSRRARNQTPLYEAELEAVAGQLIADLKLPGELYLVRWGGTRKGAGTFYTRPQLTLPTVRKTLDPLIYETCEPRAVRAPEALLSLKVCDPAMGSGSFLVAVLRVLTAAVVKSLHAHGRINCATSQRTTVDCDLLPEADRSLPTEEFDERLEATVRRAVVEHCIYGVDLDPLAVELARVALWVETLDRRLPFTFLDHKLRCGDSLVGTWLDRFRDYPLLAFDRSIPDLEHEGNIWHKALKDKRDHAISEQVDILTGQLRLQASATSDEVLEAAINRVRHLYRELHVVPTARPDERARIWRERIQTDAALASVRDAFDTWCALWFWPLDQLDTLPLPSVLGAPSEAARTVVKTLRDTHRFLHWELEFPDVFTEAGAGFDAVVGNPPWEIQKPNSKEFFSNHDPLYRAYRRQEALRMQKVLFDRDPDVKSEWLSYNGDFEDRGNFVKHAAEPYGDGKVAGHSGGDVNLVRGKKNAALHKIWREKRNLYRGTSSPTHPFQHQGSADLNTYKMFVEVCHALLRTGGQFGLLVPSGLYTDKGTKTLRHLLLKDCSWRWLYGFENRNQVFDIDSRYKFCVSIAEKGGRADTLQAAFMRHDLEDWAEAKAAITYPAKQVEIFSPKSLSLPEIRSDKDLEVLTKLYSNGVLLSDNGPDGWGIKYATEFHMTNDSKLFIARDSAEEQGFAPDEYGRWVDETGEVLLPLYEGRMIGQFDFSEKGWISGKGRSAAWGEIPWKDKRVEPQYLMSARDWEASLTTGKKTRMSGTKLVFMAIGSATNRRSMVAALVRDVPCGNAVPVLQPQAKVPGSLAIVATMNSFAYDFALREKLGGINLNYFVISETPLIRANDVLPEVLRLCAKLCLGHLWFAPTWCQLEKSDAAFRIPPSRWPLTLHERLRLNCMLDALVASLFGLERDDFAWMLKDCDHSTADLTDKAFCRQLDPKGFWRVDKSKAPVLRHTVLSITAFDDLQAKIATADGDRDAGIRAFCDQNDGDGWMLPETLCLADLGLTRTVSVGDYNAYARKPQPVRDCMGERFLGWQLTQSPEESWAECERHAKILVDEASAPPVTPGSARVAETSGQYPLSGIED